MSRDHVSRLHQRRWRIVRRAVFDRDGWRCRKCGRAGRLECDHVDPSPGRNPFDKANLQALCRGCHIAKTRDENTRPVSKEQAAWQVLVKRSNIH